MNSDQITSIYIRQKINLVSKKINCDRPFELSVGVLFQNDGLFFNSFTNRFSWPDKFHKSLILHTVCSK